MKNELEQKCMDLTITPVADLPTIAANLEIMDSDKHMVFLDQEDIMELATLFLVKGNVSGLSKKVKDIDEITKTVGAPWLLSRGVKTAKVPGIGIFSLVEGSNISISGDTLRDVLINYVSAEKVAEILEKVTKKTSYITLQFKADTVK